MAKQDKQEKQEPQSLGLAPVSFPPETQFLAVSDNDGPAAGEDGGPVVGGRGAWAKGQVGPWTSSKRLPLAIRDPKDGTIVRGWLEPVESQHYGPNGKVISVSTKYFGVRNADGEWELREPSKTAVQRANMGLASITRVLPQQAQIPMSPVAQFGIPVVR